MTLARPLVICLTVSASLVLSGAPAEAAGSLPTRAEVRDALLTRADLPGYRLDRTSGSGSGSGEPTTTTSSDPECTSKFAAMEQGGGVPRESRGASINLRDDKVFGPFVANTIGVWRTKAPGRAVLRSVRSLLRACDRWIETDEDGTTTTMRLSRLPLARLGDDRVAMRVNLTYRGDVTISARADYAVVRVNNALTSVWGLWFPFAEKVNVAPLARLSTNRLEQIV